MTAPERLDGKIAIVTGGAMGIGQAIALDLAGRGAVVAIGDIADAGETMRLIEARGCRAVGKTCDITRSESVNAFVDGIAHGQGALDVLVNCAGAGARVGLVETTDEVWRSEIELNLTGAFFMIRAAVPHMLAGAGGAIVNVSSISGVIGGLPSSGEHGRSGAAYASAKAGMIGLTKWAAREFGKQGVRVNAVAPGPVYTRLNVGYEFELESYPLPRVGTVEDMAQAVGFLASPASAYITGEVLKVAGGVGM
jgi:3-oxoacyl-[acyl-carrier protein] reductase